MAREAGALSLGVLVTPFNWEWTYPRALRTLKKLDDELGYMVVLSNEATAIAMGESATLLDVFKQQELAAGESIRMLMRLGTRFSKSNQNRLT